jgi:L-arabinose transport system permease protein
MLVLYLGLLALCSALIPRFFTVPTFAALGQLVTAVGIVACGMLFCLASGDFDLSVGSTAALAGIVAVMAANATGSAAAGVAAGLAAGAAVGLVNGFVVAKLRINALITTLAMMQVVRGLAYLLANNQVVGSENARFDKLFGSYTIAGIPTPVCLMAACFVAAGVLLHLTTFGRNTLAIGGNAEAARLAGVATVRTKILIFVLTGALAGLAGIVEASQQHIADPKAAVGLELSAISACVLGGVSLTGGVGTILAAVVGTLFMGTVQVAMNAKSVPSSYQYLITGGILLGAALYDRLKQRLTQSA